jgi:hypothetical protein
MAGGYYLSSDGCPGLGIALIAHSLFFFLGWLVAGVLLSVFYFELPQEDRNPIAGSGFHKKWVFRRATGSRNAAQLAENPIPRFA